MLLITEPHLQACDDFYEALITAHQGLSTPDSHAMNARLVLLLANHVGDHATLLQALQLARHNTQPVAASTATGPAEHCAITPIAPAHTGT